MSRLRTANLLGALSGEVTHRLERQLKTHPNQTSSSSAALNMLAYFEGCTNAQLARVLRLSHPAVVRLVDKLEADGLVESRGAAADRRAVSLFLTEAGKAQARTMLEQRCVTLSGLIDGLSESEQDQLAGLLERMLAPLATSEEEAIHICRLCDDVACPPDQCPVHQAAISAANEAMDELETGVRQ